MGRQLCVVVVAAFACKGGGAGMGVGPGTGSGTGTGSGSVAVEAPSIDVPLELSSLPPDEVLLARLYDETVKISGGRCKAPKMETLTHSHTTAKLGDGSAISMACGDLDADQWTVALFRDTGVGAKLVGAQHVDVGSISVYPLRASNARLCIELTTFDRGNVTRGYQSCAPLDGTGAVDPVVLKPFKTPTTGIPTSPAPADAIDAAYAVLSETVAGDDCTPEYRKTATGIIGKDGADELLALECGSRENHIAALFRRTADRTFLLGQNPHSDVASATVENIVVDANLRCAIYRTGKGQNELCVVR